MTDHSYLQTISFTINNLAQLDKLAAKIARIIQNHDIICFDANLGMGKTTFCKFLLKHLGVTETVISPTFSIIQTYPCKIHNVETVAHHIDLYRISCDELFDLGIEEILTNGISLIEWANKLEHYLPKNHISFHITEGHNNQRHIIIKYNPTINLNWNLLYEEHL